MATSLGAEDQSQTAISPIGRLVAPTDRPPAPDAYELLAHDP
jgi:hypothetical protein